MTLISYKNKIFFFVFCIFALFPWIQIIPNSFGIQPNLLILSLLIIILCFHETRIIKTSLLILVIPLIHTVINFSFESLKFSLPFLSLFLIFNLSYNFFKFHKVPISLFKISIYIYMFVGLVQLLIYTDFLTNIVLSEFKVNNVAGRGVKSLTAEPTYLGFHFLFIILFIFLNSCLDKTGIKKSYPIILLLLLGIIFISKSSSAIGSIIFFGAIFFFISPKYFLKKEFITISIIIVLSLLAFILLSSEFRFFSTLKLLLNFDITHDESVYKRLLIPYFAIQGSFESPIIGNGFNSWKQFYFNNALFEMTTQKILSFMGSIFFQTGIINGIIFIYIFIYKPFLFSDFTKYKIFRIPLVITLVFILLQGIPISYPLFPMLIGYLYAKKNIQS